MKKYSFPPLADYNSKILILGSLPGEKSLEIQQYYAFSQNAFWRIMFDIFEEPFSEKYCDRCNLLLKHNIALWDSIQSGNREGSLDSNIKNEEPNDIKGFLDEYKNISKILFNGKKSEIVFNKYFKDIKIRTITMPSTSPANARISYSEKLSIWKKTILDL